MDDVKIVIKLVFLYNGQECFYEYGFQKNCDKKLVGLVISVICSSICLRLEILRGGRMGGGFWGGGLQIYQVCVCNICYIVILDYVRVDF